MTIIYPRDFPEEDVIATRCNFDYAPLGELSRTAAGAITFQERMGGSLWQLSMTTRPLNETDYGKWHAWFLSLRGGSRSFAGRDPRRCWPLAYGPSVYTLPRAGSGTLFDGTCNVTAVSGNTLVLSNLPSLYKVSVGDYISFPWLGGQALVKALEPITADAAGLTPAITIGPWLRTPGAVPVVATLVRAWCTMRPTPGSWRGERQGFEPISFEAIQTLL